MHDPYVATSETLTSHMYM